MRYNFLLSVVGIKCEDVLSRGGSVSDIITCAGDLINLFVQLNWTGPPVSLDEQLASMVGGSAVLSRRNKESLDNLSWDGEVCTTSTVECTVFV